MSKKGIQAILIVMAYIFSLSGCITVATTEEIDENILQSIAYAEDKEEEEYTVMIKEQNEYVPYLVLTDDYDGSGNCLLLRKHLLHENRIYNENILGAAYYNGCVLDEFLSEEYIQNFTKELQAVMVNTDLEITNYESVIYGEDIPERIKRKIFLLSYHEVGFPITGNRPAEGTRLEYFNSDDRRIATRSNGTVERWWLRTPMVMLDMMVCSVSWEGLYFSCAVNGPGYQYESGVRPAFCLPRDTKIVMVDELNYIEADYTALDVMHNAEDRTELLYESIRTPLNWKPEITVEEEYRAEGYNLYIGNALSLKMEENKENPDYLYHTVIFTYDDLDMEELMFRVNSETDGIYFDMDYWMDVSDPYYLNCYYYVLTAEEIEVLTSYEIDCMYVSSGEGSLDNANWDTTEGILEYCELYGDGYIAK